MCTSVIDNCKPDVDLSKLTGGQGGMPTQQDVAAANAKKQQQEEARKEMLAQLLAPDAKERLSRISLVKPDKARRLEEMIIMMAKQGRLRGALDDNALKNMLEQISAGDEAAPAKAAVVYDRRRYADDSDDEIDLSDL